MIKHGVEFASAQVTLGGPAPWPPYSLQCLHGVASLALAVTLPGAPSGPLLAVLPVVGVLSKPGGRKVKLLAG
jgi:hypothetical protein